MTSRLRALRLDRGDEAETFVHADVMEGLDLESVEASDRIAAYQRWQRRKDVSPTFVIHRLATTRGPGTVWIVGHKSGDVKDLGHQLADDVRVRVQTAIRPTLRAIAKRNPLASAQTEALEDAVGALVAILVATLVPLERVEEA